MSQKQRAPKRRRPICKIELIEPDQFNSTVPGERMEKNSTMPGKKMKKNSTVPKKEMEKNSTVPDKEMEKNSTVPDKEMEKNSTVPDKEMEKNSTVPDKEMEKSTSPPSLALVATEELCLAESKRAIIARPKPSTNQMTQIFYQFPTILQLQLQLEAKRSKQAKLAKNNKVSDTKKDGLAESLNASSSSQSGYIVDQFENVNGRLNVAGNNTRYMVTTQEVERRTGYPELMNSSSLAGLLRRCKVKNCGEDMRNKLLQHGIEVDLCRRKGGHATSITGMTERELQAIAADLDLINEESFPAEEISEAVLRNAETTEERKKIADEAQDFMKLMAYFVNAANSSQPPLSGVPEVKSHNAKYHHKMKQYSLHTHGFGTLNHKTWTHQLMKIGEDLCNFVPMKSESESSDEKK